MAQGDFFTNSEVVAENGSLIIDGSTSSTGAAELHTFAAGSDQTVLKEVDTNGDGTFDASFTIVSTSSPLHSQKNKIEVSSTSNMRVRIRNDIGASQPMHVTGIEVAD